MLISEESRRSRPLILYGILAKSALSQLEHSRTEIDRSPYFDNLIRLLELYSNDVLNRHTPRAVLDRQPSDLGAIRRDKSEADAVRQALDRAHNIVYPEMTKDEVVQYLKAAFSKISNRKISEIPSFDVEKLKKFLAELTAALKNR
jgi:hypothetical protein